MHVRSTSGAPRYRRAHPISRSTTPGGRSYVQLIVAADHRSSELSRRRSQDRSARLRRLFRAARRAPPASRCRERLPKAWSLCSYTSGTRPSRKGVHDDTAPSARRRSRMSPRISMQRRMYDPGDPLYTQWRSLPAGHVADQRPSFACRLRVSRGA